MKKIILLALGMVFLTNCGDNVAVKPENRESFTENIYFSRMKGEEKEKAIEYVKKHEYNTLLEAFEKRYNKKSAEKLYEMQKNKIKEVEKMTKSKFYFVEGEEWFFFTPIDTTSIEGKIGIIDIPYLSEFSVRGTEKPLFPIAFFKN